MILQLNPKMWELPQNHDFTVKSQNVGTTHKTMILQLNPKMWELPTKP